MALSGYKNSCAKQSGGIKSVVLIGAEDILEAEYDFVSDSCKAIKLTEGAEPATYNFKEDEAIYTEQVVCSGGVSRVRHQLSFSMERMDTNSRRAVEELMEVGSRGVVAVVTTQNGVSMLVGYSEKFGTERALTLSRAVATTGARHSDTTSEIVVLQSEDGAKAPIFSGMIIP